MKTISSLLFLSVFFFAFTCQQEDVTKSNGACVKVSMLRSICGSAVLQIKDPAFYHLGENVGNEQNVFMATIESKSDAAKTKRDEIDFTDSYVVINPEDFKSDMMQCMAIPEYAGTKHYNVRFVAPCEKQED